MKDQGSILVSVYASRARIPIAGATVLIARPSSDGRQELLHMEVTNESGRTRPLHMSTKPLAASQHPGASAPFVTCDVWVEHPAFQMQRIEQVQIFPEVETIQEVALLPLAAHPAPQDLATDVIITPQPL